MKTHHHHEQIPYYAEYLEMLHKVLRDIDSEYAKWSDFDQYVKSEEPGEKI